MQNTVESLLQSLLEAKDLPQQTEKLISMVTSRENNEESYEPKDRLSLKINLLNALLPLLDDKASEQARFLINMLTIVSAVTRLKNENGGI